MAYTTIDKPTDYFNTKLYTGTGATHNVTGVGFQPNFVWLKARTSALSHRLLDSVRGTGKELYANFPDAEATNSTSLTSFDSDGFTLGSDSSTNGSSIQFASWNWLAGGTASSNTDGSITSSVSANTTAGFSIVSWTGNGTNPSTIGHGLNQKLDMMIVKNRDTASTNWIVYHSGNTSAPETDYLLLDRSDATLDFATVWNDTAPTSSVFTVGSAGSINNSGDAFITYCFHSVKGYSKFGSYTGNGNSDGTFVYTGFKPAVIIAKLSSGVSDWRIYDNKRLGYNVDNNPLRINDTRVEETDDNIDFLSNGFKWRTTDGALNGSGSTYIYTAFAESPFVSSTGIPTTAR